MNFDPPFGLTLPARRHWDRLAKEIHSQGRWACVSRDLLATFCQALVMSEDEGSLDQALSMNWLTR
jgi:hypothetical protein